MLIVTAGSGDYNYWKTIRYNEARCIEFGYGIKIYDLGGLWFGEAVNDSRCESKFRRVKSAMKPELILKALNETDDDVTWIDGDAFLVRPIDEIEADTSFDIGLTVRPKRVNKKTHYINAGVIFVKNNPAGRGFVEAWIEAMPPVPTDTTVKPKHYSDQMTLEETLVLPNIDVIPWDSYGSVHEVHGARVKFFECSKYNNFNLHLLAVWKGPDEDTKILHFKEHGMNRLNQYIEEFLSD